MKKIWLLAFLLVIAVGCTKPKPLANNPGSPGSESIPVTPIDTPGSPTLTSTEPAKPLAPAIGQLAPEIEGADLDGVEFKLSDYRGKVVVLDFWGDW